MDTVTTRSNAVNRALIDHALGIQLPQQGVGRNVCAATTDTLRNDSATAQLIAIVHRRQLGDIAPLGVAALGTHRVWRTT